MSHALTACVAALCIATAGAAEDQGEITFEEKVVQCPSFEVEAHDTDVAGTLLGSAGAATIDDCCLLCAEERHCEGFAYFEHVCYLKADFAGTFAKAGVVSRLRKDLGTGCAGFAPAQQDQDLVGDLLEDWSSPTAEVCCAACSEKADCDGFAFLDDRCYLKGNVRGAYAHDGCLVRVKEGVLPGVGPTPALPQCPLFEMEAVDSDVAGSLIAERGAASSDACCPLCEEIDGCDGFSYFDNVCYLKGNFSGTFSKAGVVSRVKKALGSGCPGFSAARHGKDLVGDLLGAWAAPSAEICCAACAEKPDCQGFAFLDRHCYLKGNVRGTYDRIGCVAHVKEGIMSESGVSPTPAECPRFEMQETDTDLAGALLGAHWAATFDECCPLCEAEDGCQGVAYFEQVCYLKAAFVGSFHAVGVLSSLKIGLGSGCPGFAVAQQGKDLAGELLDFWLAPNPEVCCAACGERPDCQGFAFSDEYCYLKGNVQGTYEHDGCMAQTKEAPMAKAGGDRRLAGRRFLV